MKTTTALFFALSLFGSLALAHEGQKHELSADDRKKMAEMHQKMADCLKSDKTMDQCHQEMMQSCKDMGDACHMMGMMGHHGMHHEKPAKPEEKK